MGVAVGLEQRSLIRSLGDSGVGVRARVDIEGRAEK